MRAMFLIAAVMFLAACSGGGASDTTAAAFYCEEAIKERIKAPATARFSGQFETAVADLTPPEVQTPNDKTYGRVTFRVAGYVDAQNSFGAMLRLGYDCTIHGYGASGQRKWTVSELRF